MTDSDSKFLDAGDQLNTALTGLGRCQQGIDALGHVMEDEQNPEVGAWMDDLISLLPEIAGRIEQHRNAIESAHRTIDELHRDAAGMPRRGAALNSV